jgi:hypothetical protein
MFFAFFLVPYPFMSLQFDPIFLVLLAHPFSQCSRLLRGVTTHAHTSEYVGMLPLANDAGDLLAAQTLVKALLGLGRVGVVDELGLAAQAQLAPRPRPTQTGTTAAP